jgi:hypothetical protein
MRRPWPGTAPEQCLAVARLIAVVVEEATGTMDVSETVDIHSFFVTIAGYNIVDSCPCSTFFPTKREASCPTHER